MSTNVKQVYALRAFLGVFESSAYPGTVTLLSKSQNNSVLLLILLTGFTSHSVMGTFDKHHYLEEAH